MIVIVLDSYFLHSDLWQSSKSKHIKQSPALIWDSITLYSFLLQAKFNMTHLTIGKLIIFAHSLLSYDTIDYYERQVSKN